MAIYIFRGSCSIAVLILIGLMVAMVEEICRKGVIDEMRWRDPNPGRDEKALSMVKKSKEIS